MRFSFVNRTWPDPIRYVCRCGWRSAPRRSTPTCPVCARLMAPEEKPKLIRWMCPLGCPCQVSDYGSAPECLLCDAPMVPASERPLDHGEHRWECPQCQQSLIDLPPAPYCTRCKVEMVDAPERRLRLVKMPPLPKATP